MKIVASSDTFEKTTFSERFFLDIIVSFMFFGQFTLPELTIKAE